MDERQKEMEEIKMTTRSWKIYGADGHRQRLSFGASKTYDWRNIPDRPLKVMIAFECADKIGTHDYVIMRIIADNAEACESELHAQLSDGFFENSRFGKIIEII